MSISIIGQQKPNYKERDLVPFGYLQKENSGKTTVESGINPDTYIVSPGENIFISVSGIEEINHNLYVNAENYLFIPNVGGINLKGLTLAQARSKIKSVLEKSYKNVDIFISIGTLKKIKVFLVGDVKKPSALILESNAKLMDLFADSSGLNITSSFRNIQIKDASGNIKRYDILSFLRYGDSENNPLLNDGDVVFVDRADKVVTISGAVKYPATYEFVEGETVANLIKLAGGLLFTARSDSIELIRFDEDGKTQKSFYFSLEDLQTEKIELKLKDIVVVRIKPEYYIDNFVMIEGWVNYPGYYKIEEGKTTLTGIIKEAGGFRKDASIQDATVYRTTGAVEIDPEFERLKTLQRADMTDDEYDYLKAKSRQRRGKVVVDFEALFLKNNLEEDIILKRGDKITVPEAKNYVILIGQVINPGSIVYNPNYTVQDYIRLAGGFGWRAVENDVRVIKSSTGEWLDEKDVEAIDPGDTIWIPEHPPGPKFWDVFTTTLQILGQIAAVIAATIAVIVAAR